MWANECRLPIGPRSAVSCENALQSKIRRGSAHGSALIRSYLAVSSPADRPHIQLYGVVGGEYLEGVHRLPASPGACIA